MRFKIFSSSIGRACTALLLAISLSACGSGSGSETGSVAFEENEDGTISGYSFSTEIVALSSAGLFPDSTTIRYTFSKPVRRSGDQLVTIEPMTLVRMEQDQSILDMGIEYSVADFHVWNFDGNYPGKNWDSSVQTQDMKLTVPLRESVLDPINQNTTEGWIAWYQFFKRVLADQESKLEDFLIEEAGVTFEPWRVEFQRPTSDDSFPPFAVAFNPGGLFAAAEQLPETFEISLLIDGSPFFTRLEPATGGVECGRKLTFLSDGVVTSESLSGDVLSGAYTFTELGVLEMTGLTAEPETLIIGERLVADGTQIGWSAATNVGTASQGRENAFTNNDNIAEMILVTNSFNLTCEFDFN